MSRATATSTRRSCGSYSFGSCFAEVESAAAVSAAVVSRGARAAAATLYLDCRSKGVTVRSTLDCLVAQCAIEHGLVLLHNDRDFAQMGAVRKTLKQRHFIE